MKKEVTIIFFLIMATIFVYSSPGAPSITGLSINATTDLNNLTTSNLTINFTVTDPDGDNVKNITVWYYGLANNSLPVLYLPFENNSNASLTEDYSSYHHNGNVSNALWDSTEGYDGFGAYNFSSNGGGSYINVPTLDALARSNHTYGGWFKFNTTLCPNNYCILMQQADVSDSGVEMYIDSSDDKVYCYDDSLAYINSSAITVDNTWNHIMCWHNDTEMCIYVNGVGNGCVAAVGGKGSNSDDFYIGGGGTQNTYWFNGTVDEVYVFNKSLSAEQIKFLYENRTDLISSEETNKRDYWHASVTPVDINQEKGNQVNSSYFYIMSNISIEKKNYLGKSRTFSVEFDDMAYENENYTGVTYRKYYEGLIDFLDLYDKTNGTKYSWALIPNPKTKNSNKSNLTDPNNNFRWIMADSEYDKRITLCLHGYNHSNDYSSNDPAEADRTTQNSINIYKEVIGRNATCWKFPRYAAGSYGWGSLLQFPYIVLANAISGQRHNITRAGSRKVIKDQMGSSVPTSFTNNYLASGHFSPNISNTRDGLNRTAYFDDLLTLINYAEAQNNINYEDWRELGEIWDMYNFTNLTVLNKTSFKINDDATYWTYRKRLAIEIKEKLNETYPYINITTPSGLKVAQNMINYDEWGLNRTAIIIIPVENGTYTLTPSITQPTDPSFEIQNFTIFANNTKWGFNGSQVNASAYTIFKIVWTGDSNVWGSYNNTNNNINITHGFRFNQSQGDNWWVEHDMKTGKLHILGASGSGIEYIHAGMPFTFTKSVNEVNFKRYILNATGVFKNITGNNINLSIPEDYNSDWGLNISYANGTTITNKKFYDGGSIIFSVPIIMEDESMIIEYYDNSPPIIDLTPSSNTNLNLHNSLFISCTATSDVNISTLEIILGGSTICSDSTTKNSITCSYEYDANNLGTHDLTCTASNIFGNTNSQSTTITVRSTNSDSLPDDYPEPPTEPPEEEPEPPEEITVEVIENEIIGTVILGLADIGHFRKIPNMSIIFKDAKEKLDTPLLRFFPWKLFVLILMIITFISITYYSKKDKT